MSIRIEIKEEKTHEEGTENNISTNWIEEILNTTKEEINKDEELYQVFGKVFFCFTNLANAVHIDNTTTLIPGTEVLATMIYKQIEAITYYVFEYDIEKAPENEDTLRQYTEKAVDEYIKLAEKYDEKGIHEIIVFTKIMSDVSNMFGLQKDLYTVFITISKKTFEYACKNKDRIFVKLEP